MTRDPKPTDTKQTAPAPRSPPSADDPAVTASERLELSDAPDREPDTLIPATRHAAIQPMTVKRYEGKQIEVTYDSARCLHAAECVHGMPGVFDTAKRPWVAPDEGDPETLAAVIRRCPTGALHYTLREGEREQPRAPTRLRRPTGGPLLIEGNIELDGQRETRAAICRCWQSANQPYCDRSGPCRDWTYQPDAREVAAP